MPDWIFSHPSWPWAERHAMHDHDAESKRSPSGGGQGSQVCYTLQLKAHSVHVTCRGTCTLKLATVTGGPRAYPSADLFTSGYLAPHSTASP